MNFYASPEYLSVVANVYYRGRRTEVEDVRIGNVTLRLLVVNGNITTCHPFLDYHMPLREDVRSAPRLRSRYADFVVQGDIGIDEWNRGSFDGSLGAPYTDWSQFPDYGSYLSAIKNKGGRLLREAARHRRRLADEFGELEFCMNDTQKDVFELARKWKSAHLRRTGGKDFFTDQRNVEFFHALRERNLLISSTLRASGRLLSAWLGFIYQGSWSGWVFAYDPDPHLRKYSVGRQLLHEMLEESYRRGHREFDFSRSAQDYKTLYATRVRLLGTEGRPPLRVRAARRSRANIKMILGLHEPSLNLARGIVRSLRNADFDEFVRRKLWATSLEAIGRTFEKASHLIAKDTRSGRQPTLGRRPEGNLQRDRCEEFLETAPEQPAGAMGQEVRRTRIIPVFESRRDEICKMLPRTLPRGSDGKDETS